MPEVLANVQTYDTYVPQLTLGPVKGALQVSFQGFDQPFFVQLYKADPRDSAGRPILDGVERVYPAGGSDSFTNCLGAEFRSYTPGSPATIAAQLAYATDPVSLGAPQGAVTATPTVTPTLASVTIDSTGDVAMPVANTGYVGVGGNLTAIGTWLVIAHIVVATPAVAANRITAVLEQFSQKASAYLPVDETEIFVGASAAGEAVLTGIVPVLASSSQPIRVRAFSSSTNCTIKQNAPDNSQGVVASHIDAVQIA